ncbi:MAG TPA: Fe-S cluster assembly protein SufD [Chloroflexota bacterium]|nr:Fe-S cluster assembly protein SufD [Chloroflexota bacterium]
MSRTTDEVVSAGLDQAAVEALSRAKNEPAWLRALRQSAFEAFQTTPMPTLKDEEWRRTDVRALKLNDVVPFADLPRRVSSADVLDAAIRAELNAAGQTGGVIVQQDNGGVFGTLAESLAKQGVIFTDLDTAVREHGDLVQQYLTKNVAVDYNKFAALNTAFWSGGVFLYVPRRVEVTLPLQALNYMARPGVANLSRALIVAEPDSDVVLVDQWLGTDQESQGFASNVQEVFVGAGARVRYYTLQEWGRNVWNFSVNRTVLGRDSTSNSLVVAFGGRFHKANVESALQGPGCTSEMLGVLFGNQRQFFDHHTLQDHQAPHTSSDLLYKGALTDRARSVFSGMIHARKAGQKTDAIQTNRNLLLSGEARADSIPNLEIEANDLRCTHAATVAPVDEEEMFYLRSRALPEADAKRLIVEGFFEPVLERIPLPGIVDRLRAVIEGKID